MSTLALTRRMALVIGGCFALSLAAVPALAAKDEIYTGLLSGAAVGGYDAVAYFKQGKPVKGSSDFTTEYKGATWYFANAEDLEAFKAAPEKYAPQYGGYCAWAVSQGATAKGDPEFWSVVDGKLYLNYSADVQANWSQDIPGNVAKADANWPKVLQ